MTLQSHGPECSRPSLGVIKTPESLQSARDSLGARSGQRRNSVTTIDGATHRFSSQFKFFWAGRMMGGSADGSFSCRKSSIGKMSAEEKPR
jgi:hypothetical protein